MDELITERVYKMGFNAAIEKAANVVENWHTPPWHCNTCGGEGIAQEIRKLGEAKGSQDASRLTRINAEAGGKGE